MSYYEYMDGDGFPSKVLIDDHGQVKSEYPDAHGKTSIGAYDVVPLIDEYVRKHPDFSSRGSKGPVAMTGYNGVRGYRTSKSEYPKSKTMAKDTETATQVADAMKANGWVFASHSWGHIDMGKTPMPRFARDMKLWDAEVRPIIGDTDQLIYPFGADIARVERYGAPGTTRSGRTDSTSSTGSTEPRPPGSRRAIPTCARPASTSTDCNSPRKGAGTGRC
ncbi:hypothetical protein [Paeniglutamicibacter kerguelensis]|uniref:Polysaccharide deacetylase family protein n=1 Tax=Paeniglutamicibacter kerguelensis TaxID=254788 RepID=A0ABS4X8L6_9MICC|nr:hypothetical protein [Paeniglutamicibacter kerguelensis]MBP2384723.1 hypothetical protein [Paeniglutamicibacter kerguelensis]